MRNLQRALVLTAVSAALVSLGGQAAVAGEITGNGTLKGTNGKSACSFSGQNDGYHIPAESHGDQDAKTRVQSYGQIVRHAGSLGGLPGKFCNPTSESAH